MEQQQNKAPVQDDDDDEVLELKDRLAAYKIDSSPDRSEGKTQSSLIVESEISPKHKFTCGIETS